MTASVATAISDFLRDAQARVGVLTQQISDAGDQGGPVVEDLVNQRQALYAFMVILNDKYTLFHDATTTFIQAQYLDSKYPSWTDREVIEEIQYLRFYGQLLTLPYFVFVGYYPEIIGPIPSSGFNPGPGWNPPAGDFLQILRYDGSGNLVVTDFPDFAGAVDDAIDAYFAGRVTN